MSLTEGSVACDCNLLQIGLQIVARRRADAWWATLVWFLTVGQVSFMNRFNHYHVLMCEAGCLGASVMERR